MIPQTHEQEIFYERVGKYLTPSIPEYEVSFTGVPCKRGNHLVCSFGIFKGLFTKVPHNQEMVTSFSTTVSLVSDERVHEFVDDLIREIFNRASVENPCVRICIDKFFFSDMTPYYKKYLDVHVNLIKTNRDFSILENVVYFLLRYSVAGEYIVKSKRKDENADKIWALFPQSPECSNLSLSF